MIVGTGGLGLWACKLAKAFYADKIEILAVDLDQSKLDLAKKYGADDVALWPK